MSTFLVFKIGISYLDLMDTYHDYFLNIFELQNVKTLYYGFENNNLSLVGMVLGELNYSKCPKYKMIQRNGL